MRQFNVGQTYYVVQYKDDKLATPIISSCAYKGLGAMLGGEQEHLFSLVGFADTELSFLECDLNTLILDLPAVIKELLSINLATKGIDNAP